MSVGAPWSRVLVHALQLADGEVVRGVRMTLFRCLLEPLHRRRPVLIHSFPCVKSILWFIEAVLQDETDSRGDARLIKIDF